METNEVWDLKFEKTAHGDAAATRPGFSFDPLAEYTHVVHVPEWRLHEGGETATAVRVWLHQWQKRHPASGQVTTVFVKGEKVSGYGTNDPVYAAVMATVAAHGWDAALKVIDLVNAQDELR